MPFPPIIAIVVVVRAVMYFMQRSDGPGAGTQSTPTPPGTTPWGNTIAIGVVEVLAFSVLLAFTPVFPPAILLALGVALAMFPWPLALYAAVPLGAVRVAYHLGRWSDVVWRLDFEGGGLVAGARALLRQDAPHTESLVWLEDRLAAAHPVLPGALLAAGLLAWARGDRVSAKRLIEGIGWFRTDRVPSLAWSQAREWLVVDAASEGDWPRAARLARNDGRPTSNGAQLLGGVAQHLVGAPNRPAPTALWLRWATTPGRELTRPLVERALAAKPPVVNAASDVAEAEDPLVHALRRHAAVARREAPTRIDLEALAKAWDHAAADATLAPIVLERAADLGARTGSAALPRFFDEVRQELTVFASRGDVPLHDLPSTGILASAAQSARDTALREVEQLAQALELRVERKRELPGIDEAREFLQLASAWDRLGEIGGVASQRLVFGKVHTALCALAVQLFNTRGERPLGNAMFRWLLDASKKAGTQAAIELQTKNVACGF